MPNGETNQEQEKIEVSRNDNEMPKALGCGYHWKIGLYRTCEYTVPFFGALLALSLTLLVVGGIMKLFPGAVSEIKKVT